MSRLLSPTQAARIYDRLAPLMNLSAVVEDRATNELLERLEPAQAASIFEFGCGTGHFAAQLLVRAPSARYLGVDVSSGMVARARRTLRPFAARAEVRLGDGGVPAWPADASCDRFVSNYVLDLLPEAEIAQVLAEAGRMLKPGGLLALASLTEGHTPSSRLLMRGWSWLHARQPALVAGCRAIRLLDYLPAAEWQVLHHQRVAPLAVPLEAVLARRL
ncbi:MAG: class I SAM-dependent methyltransferase [Perlucidibaca sp.]